MILLIGFFLCLILLNALWLALISDLLSRFVFQEDAPLARALKCTGTAYAISWAIWGAIAAMGWLGGFTTLNLVGIGVGLVAPAIVFLWEWRSFSRHWSPDGPDLAKTFE